jgi:hypothetical protein
MQALQRRLMEFNRRLTNAWGGIPGGARIARARSSPGDVERREEAQSGCDTKTQWAPCGFIFAQTNSKLWPSFPIRN